jgi:thiamine-phosphate pyrophosphorylase
VSERALPPPLVALTPGDLQTSQFDSFLGVVDSTIGAGLRGILVREPELSDRDLLRLATEISRRLPADGYLALHDRVYLAVPGGARAVHVGFRSLAPRDVRTIVPDEIAIGFSAHAGDARAAWEGADYVFFGPVFDTPSKRGVMSATGTEELALAARSAGMPVFAIGGITPERVPFARRAGARGVAVRAGVFQAFDPAAAVRAYSDALASCA